MILTHQLWIIDKPLIFLFIYDHFCRSTAEQQFLELETRQKRKEGERDAVWIHFDGQGTVS